MKSLTTKQKIALTLMGGAGVLAAAAPSAFADAAIANDTLEGLPSVGQDIGDFLTNLAPGLGAFIIIVSVFLGVAGIIWGIVYLVKHLASNMGGMGK